MSALELPPPVVARPIARDRRVWMWAGLAGLVLVTWLLNTPASLLGKADAVGYAVCHRIDLRSFHLGDRPLPLCARCTGMYLGALLGLAYMALLGRGRAGQLPPRRVLAALGLGMLAFAVDGLNSFAHLIPGAPHLYEPNNSLRLVTGTLAGLLMAAMLYPAFNQTVWRNWQARPVLGGLRELAGLWLAAAALIALTLSEQPVVLYPLALLSALGVLAVLVLLFSTILLILLRQENRAEGWTGAAWPLLAGLALAVAQVGLIDLARYSVFGAWSGFSLPG